MTGIQIQIDSREFERAGVALQDLLRRAGQLGPMLDEVGNMLANSTRHRFETGRGPGGEPWTPSRRAREQGGQTLLDKGHLRDSITHEAGASSVAIGSNLIYAGIHQLGGTITGKGGKRLRFPVPGGWATVASVTIPARPFLGVDDDDQAEIGAIVQDYLGGAFEGGRP